MGALKWHKRDHCAALTGMMVLNLEERGAYNTVLDLIYAHDGELADDAKFISSWLAVDPRKWKRLRLRLIECGKIFVHAGQIHNRRADEEVHEALHRVASMTEAANKRWATYRQIKGLSDASFVTPTSTTTKLLSLVPPKRK